MLYLIDTDELYDGNKTIKISKAEFTRIFMELIERGMSKYNGEIVTFSPKFSPKVGNFEKNREISSEINLEIMRRSLKEDQIIDKLMRTIDETEKFMNFTKLKEEEIQIIMKYSLGLEESASRIIGDFNSDLAEHLDKLENTLRHYIEKIAPNLSRLVGYKVAARLVSQSGSIRDIAMSTAGSIQILGAEKAFFRFKRGHGTPPKHGLIYEIPDIYKSPKKIAGKIARIYSNGIVKAARADLMGLNSEVPEITKQMVEKLKNQYKT